ncbi:MAG: hypothetical protein ABSA46_13205 [Thermodesulfovibrionales bacterium]|jgi:hypothetical protein
MTITITARQKVRNNTRSTVRDALKYINAVLMAEWVNIVALSQDKARINLIEKLIHRRSKRKAVHEENTQLRFGAPYIFSA